MLKFYDQTRQSQSGNWGYLQKLGVWNKEYGSKVIDSHGLHVNSVFVRNEYLFIEGWDAESQLKTAIIPIKNGYWGEKASQEELESEKSWWYKMKPSWWPS